MARKLESFPSAALARYPWDEWLDGSVWELVRGEDFQSKMATFRANAQLQAKRRGGRVRTKLVDAAGREAVAIQFQRN